MLCRNSDLVQGEKPSIRKHFGFKHDKNLNFVDCTQTKKTYDRSLSVRRLRTKSKDRVLKKPKYRHRFCFIPKDYKYSKRDVALLSGNETNELVGMFAQKVSRPKYITHLTSAKARKTASLQKKKAAARSPLMDFGNENSQRKKCPWLKIRATLSKSAAGSAEGGRGSGNDGSDGEMETDIVILSPAYNIEFNGHSKAKPIRLMPKERNYENKKYQFTENKKVIEYDENDLRYYDCCGDGNNEINKQYVHMPKCTLENNYLENQKTINCKEMLEKLKKISCEHSNLKKNKDVKNEASRKRQNCKDQVNLAENNFCGSHIKNAFSLKYDKSESENICISKNKDNLKSIKNLNENLKNKSDITKSNSSQNEKKSLNTCYTTNRSILKSNLRGSSGINLRKKLDSIYVKKEDQTKMCESFKKNKIKQSVDTFNLELMRLNEEIETLTELNMKTIKYQRRKIKSVQLLDSLIRNSCEYCSIFRKDLDSKRQFHYGLKNQKQKIGKAFVDFNFLIFLLTIFSCLMFLLSQF